MTIKINPDNEDWLPVVGYEGLYEVSSLGRVRSLPRAACRGRILKTAVGGTGYPRCGLSRDGKLTARSVHSLVAEAFIGPRPEGQEVRHLDGTRTNCAADNLAYGTRTQNSEDARRHGTLWQFRKTHCPQGHPYAGDNLAVVMQGGRPTRYCRTCINARATARRDAGSICGDCKHGRTRHRFVAADPTRHATRGAHVGHCKDCDCPAWKNLFAEEAS